MSRTSPAGEAYVAGRRRARIVAMQTLYEIDQSGRQWQIVLDGRLDEAMREQELPEAHVAFARTLASGAWSHRDDADRMLSLVAPQWPVDQLPAVEKAILRLAIFELCFDNKTPPRAAINEAVELAKAYGGEHSSRFVNGVLGSIASQVDKDKHNHGQFDL